MWTQIFPWIFRDIKAALDDTAPQIPLSLAEKFGLLRRQISESIERIDEYRGILHIRRHLAVSPLLKGIPNFRDTRVAILRASTKDELMDLLAHVQHDIIPSLDERALHNEINNQNQIDLI